MAYRFFFPNLYFLRQAGEPNLIFFPPVRLLDLEVRLLEARLLFRFVLRRFVEGDRVAPDLPDNA